MNASTYLEIRPVVKGLVVRSEVDTSRCCVGIALLVALDQPESQEDCEGELDNGAAEHHLDAGLIDGRFRVEERVRSDNVADTAGNKCKQKLSFGGAEECTYYARKTKAVAVTRLV